jgi:hypothetical protein
MVATRAGSNTSGRSTGSRGRNQEQNQGAGSRPTSAGRGVPAPAAAVSDTPAPANASPRPTEPAGPTVVPAAERAAALAAAAEANQRTEPESPGLALVDSTNYDTATALAANAGIVALPASGGPSLEALAADNARLRAWNRVRNSVNKILPYSGE